jgi:hypothetical protein
MLLAALDTHFILTIDARLFAGSSDPVSAPRTEESRAVGKTIKHTDLSGEDPGPRAIVNLPQEAIKFSGKLPLVGGKLIVQARMTPGSSLNRLVAAIALASCGCACAMTLYVIGLPGWVAAAALLLPSVIYLCCTRRRPGK